ncbi:MAG: TRAP transporter small permease subunit [Pseudomonadota bacterium]
MSNAAVADAIPAEPAPLVRAFGWSMLFLLAAFMLNVVLTFWGGLPGIAPVMGWNTQPAGAISFLQLALYAVAVAGACAFAFLTPGRTLRQDSARIHNFNLFLIRAAFWVVFLVGLTDAVISFLRVEGLLPDLVGEDMETDLGKSAFRGMYVHVPVVLLGIAMACVTRTLGFIWLTLLVVVAELAIVFTRFVFSYEQAFMGDLVRFWYAALFLFASAYTLYQDGHVRVDVLYTGMSRRTKGRVNAIGSILLGITLCWTVLLLGMWTKSAIIVSPILVFETTQSGFGMYVKYFMAGFLAVFAVSMMIQFVSYLFESVADARGEEGTRETAGTAH